MKKVLLLGLALIGSACSSDDGNVGAPSARLPKHVEITSDNPDYAFTYNFEYDGNDRIRRLENEGNWEARLGYTADDKISEIHLTSALNPDVDIEITYDEARRMSGINRNGNETAVVYDAGSETYTSEFFTAKFNDNGDLNQWNSRYYAYQPSYQGAFFHSPVNYHVLALFISDANLGYFATSAPLTMVIDGGNSLEFLNSYDDNNQIVDVVYEGELVTRIGFEWW